MNTLRHHTVGLLSLCPWVKRDWKGPAFSLGGDGQRQAKSLPGLPPLIWAHHSGELHIKEDIHEEQPEEFGLLSQLLFIFCALKSLEI